MVDVSASLRIEAHNIEETLTYRDNLFRPASGWNYFMRRNMQEIVPGVYLGPYSSALKHFQNCLLEQGITYIICVRQGSEAHFIYPQLNENFKYLTLDIVDRESEDIIRHIPVANRFIRNALSKKAKVLVHGNAGISRSASLVLAYVMETFNYSYIDALKLVKEKRGCIKPNQGFIAQLFEYEMIYKTDKYYDSTGHCSRINTKSKRKRDGCDDSTLIKKLSDAVSSCSSVESYEMCC